MLLYERGRIALPLIVLLVGCTGFCVIAFAQPCEPGWDGRIGDPGLRRKPLHALAVFDDGRGPALYAGGEFTEAGGVEANYIARWDGDQWAPVGSGFNDDGWGMIVFDDGSGPALFAAGWFTEAGGVPANHVAKWDGSAWSPLGVGLNNWARDWAIFDDGSGPALYVAGQFTSAGGKPANYIAKWDGRQWSQLGNGTNRPAVELTVFDDGSGQALYVGGYFTVAGGVPAGHIAKWDGSSWSAVGSGVAGGDWVAALTVFDDGGGPCLYVGGDFTEAGGVPADYVARWNGEVFEPVGVGMDWSVVELTVHDYGTGPALYAGGWFRRADGREVNGIAWWDGRKWLPLSDEAPDHRRTIFTMLSAHDKHGPTLYVGGDFSGPDSCRTENNISEWRCPYETVPCDRINRMKARCRPHRSIVKGVVVTRGERPETGHLDVTFDAGDPKTLWFKRCYHKAKVKWPGAAPGVHELCIAECPEWCVEVECP